MSKKVIAFLFFGSLGAALAKAPFYPTSKFMKHGPFQQGTVKINRSRLQTVVTWCSPTLLEMRVFDSVQTTYASLYQKLKGEDHPLQLSVTVFPPKLPFSYAADYSGMSYVTSICSPAHIHTTLASSSASGYPLKSRLGVPVNVKSDQVSVLRINCDQKRIGVSSGDLKMPAYGSVGGMVLIPVGDKVTAVGRCQNNGFTVRLK